MPQCLWHILYQTRPPGAIGWRWVDIKISTLEKALLAVTAAFLLLAAGYFLGARSGTEPYRVEARPAAAETEPLLPAGTPAPETPEKVNINTASAEELEALPGIGEKRAQSILEYREEHGPFQTVDELDHVSGIGQGILDGLREYATVE